MASRRPLCTPNGCEVHVRGMGPNTMLSAHQSSPANEERPFGFCGIPNNIIFAKCGKNPNVQKQPTIHVSSCKMAVRVFPNLVRVFVERAKPTNNSCTIRDSGFYTLAPSTGAKTRTRNTNQRFTSQIAKWPFVFFRNWLGFL